MNFGTSLFPGESTSGLKMFWKHWNYVLNVTFDDAILKKRERNYYKYSGLIYLTALFIYCTEQENILTVRHICCKINSLVC